MARDSVVSQLQLLCEKITAIHRPTASALEEACDLLKDDHLQPAQVAAAARFGQAFGRGQQYLSLIKTD